MRRSSTSVRIQTSFLPIPGCVGARIRSEWPSSQQQLPEPKWPLVFVRLSLCVSGSAVNVSVSCPSSSLRPSLLGSSFLGSSCYDWLPSLSAGRTRKLGRRNFPVERSRSAAARRCGGTMELRRHLVEGAVRCVDTQYGLIYRRLDFIVNLLKVNAIYVFLI
ncbi:hypothetical protein AMECASPLE_004666 [Ameca splendens]|uniref:Uncharacterized protein n=1 Tax=Ameca splendens TaxID=208324 RepID=A0ABV1A559_9TELE